jgi:hypothetical protein
MLMSHEPVEPVEPDGATQLVELREPVIQLRGIFARLAPERSLADELIAERRREAAQEASE